MIKNKFTNFLVFVSKAIISFVMSLHYAHLLTPYSPYCSCAQTCTRSVSILNKGQNLSKLQGLHCTIYYTQSWSTVDLLDKCAQSCTHEKISQLVASLQTSRQQVVFAYGLFQAVSKLGTSCLQPVLTLLILSDLLQGCCNKTDIEI